MIETIGLQTARGRLLFFGIISVAVFLAPYEWLGRLSIWQALDIPSPSIGLTRSYHLLLHGNFEGAWQRNKLIFIVLAIGSIVLIRDVRTVIKQQAAKNKRAV